jgi:hypothetical protein
MSADPAIDTESAFAIEMAASIRWAGNPLNSPRETSIQDFSKE